MDAAATTVTPSSLPTGVFLVISMFIVSLALRAANKDDATARLIGVRRMFYFALAHVVLGTALNLGLTWFTLGPSDASPSGKARVVAYLIASGLNGFFPSALGLGGVIFLWVRDRRRNR